MTEKIRKIINTVLICFAGVIALGIFLSELILAVLPRLFTGSGPWFNIMLIIEPQTYLIGFLAVAVILVLTVVFQYDNGKRSSRLMKQKAKAVEGALENSRFMSDKDRDAKKMVFLYMQFIIKRKKNWI